MSTLENLSRPDNVVPTSTENLQNLNEIPKIDLGNGNVALLNREANQLTAELSTISNELEGVNTEGFYNQMKSGATKVIAEKYGINLNAKVTLPNIGKMFKQLGGTFSRDYKTGASSFGLGKAADSHKMQASLQDQLKNVSTEADEIIAKIENNSKLSDEQKQEYKDRINTVLSKKDSIMENFENFVTRRSLGGSEVNHPDYEVITNTRYTVAALTASQVALFGSVALQGTATLGKIGTTFLNLGNTLRQRTSSESGEIRKDSYTEAFEGMRQNLVDLNNKGYLDIIEDQEISEPYANDITNLKNLLIETLKYNENTDIDLITSLLAKINKIQENSSIKKDSKNEISPISGLVNQATNLWEEKMGKTVTGKALGELFKFEGGLKSKGILTVFSLVGAGLSASFQTGDMQRGIGALASKAGEKAHDITQATGLDQVDFNQLNPFHMNSAVAQAVPLETPTPNYAEMAENLANHTPEDPTKNNYLNTLKSWLTDQANGDLTSGLKTPETLNNELKNLFREQVNINIPNISDAQLNDYLQKQADTVLQGLGDGNHTLQQVAGKIADPDIARKLAETDTALLQELGYNTETTTGFEDWRSKVVNLMNGNPLENDEILPGQVGNSAESFVNPSPATPPVEIIPPTDVNPDTGRKFVDAAGAGAIIGAGTGLVAESVRTVRKNEGNSVIKNTGNIIGAGLVGGAGGALFGGIGGVLGGAVGTTIGGVGGGLIMPMRPGKEKTRTVTATTVGESPNNQTRLNVLHSLELARTDTEGNTIKKKLENLTESGTKIPLEELSKLKTILGLDSSDTEEDVKDEILYLLKKANPTKEEIAKLQKIADMYAPVTAVETDAEKWEREQREQLELIADNLLKQPLPFGEKGKEITFKEHYTNSEAMSFNNSTRVNEKGEKVHWYIDVLTEMGLVADKLNLVASIQQVQSDPVVNKSIVIGKALYSIVNKTQLTPEKLAIAKKVYDVLLNSTTTETRNPDGGDGEAEKELKVLRKEIELLFNDETITLSNGTNISLDDAVGDSMFWNQISHRLKFRKTLAIENFQHELTKAEIDNIKEYLILLKNRLNNETNKNQLIFDKENLQKILNIVAAQAESKKPDTENDEEEEANLTRFYEVLGSQIFNLNGKMATTDVVMAEIHELDPIKLQEFCDKAIRSSNVSEITTGYSKLFEIGKIKENLREIFDAVAVGRVTSDTLRKAEVFRHIIDKVNKPTPDTTTVTDEALNDFANNEAIKAERVKNLTTQINSFAEKLDEKAKNDEILNQITQKAKYEADVNNKDEENERYYATFEQLKNPENGLDTEEVRKSIKNELENLGWKKEDLDISVQHLLSGADDNWSDQGNAEGAKVKLAIGQQILEAIQKQNDEIEEQYKDLLNTKINENQTLADFVKELLDIRSAEDRLKAAEKLAEFRNKTGIKPITLVDAVLANLNLGTFPSSTLNEETITVLKTLVEFANKPEIKTVSVEEEEEEGDELNNVSTDASIDEILNGEKSGNINADASPFVL